MVCEELKKVVVVPRARMCTKRMPGHPEFISFVLILLLFCFVFTILLYQGIIYDVSQFQEGKFQDSHKIFVNKVEKYRLTGQSWAVGWIVSLLAEIGNIGEKTWGRENIIIAILRDGYGISQ